jgi:uncharacterized protein (TIGR02996 family)
VDDDPAHKAFIDAIAEDPDDDTARLVYADWLDERGDPRAEYLRLEVEHGKVGNKRDRRRIKARLHELARKLEPRWVSCMTYEILLTNYASRFLAEHVTRKRAHISYAVAADRVSKLPCSVERCKTRVAAVTILERLRHRWKHQLTFEVRLVGWR